MMAPEKAVRTALLLSAATLLAAPGAQAQDLGDAPPPVDREITYSPYPEEDFPNNVYFGDTHLHTSYSTTRPMPA
jgi:hypothetical protein